MAVLLYPCSTKTREVLGNPSPTPKRFPETREISRGKSRVSILSCSGWENVKSGSDFQLRCRVESKHFPTILCTPQWPLMGGQSLGKHRWNLKGLAFPLLQSQLKGGLAGQKKIFCLRGAIKGTAVSKWKELQHFGIFSTNGEKKSSHDCYVLVVTLG